MKYRVDLSQTVYETATIEIEADSPEKAERLAEEKTTNGEIDADWRFTDTAGDIEAICSELIP